MILFNKTLSEQRLIVTVSENNISDGNILKLKVENKQSNVNYELILPANTSEYKERYDEFIIPTSSITTWSENTYYYIIKEYNGSTEVQVLQIGLLKVIGIVTEEFISVEENETEDDFIVYQES